MKARIKYKLFFAMLAATGAVVISMFLIMQWSIGHGFLAYVNMMERERFDRLEQVLEQAYGANGGWEFLQQDRSAWFRLVFSTLPREGGEPERMGRRGGRPMPEFAAMSSHNLPPRMANRFESRVVLLDAQRRQIAGIPGNAEQFELRKISSGGRVVGYLGLRPRQHLTDRHQLLFVKQQKLAMGLIAAMMLLISAAISLPLANRLVLPIRRLAASMHRLASGEFETRVDAGPEDELGQLSRDFNALALSLEENERARRRWVADISHELRTPLSILRGEIEAIQDGVREGGAESMRSLHAEVMHLSRLVEDLHQISLYDVGALNYRKEPLDLKELLEDVLDSFSSRFMQKGITVVADLPRGDGYTVFADELRLNQLFGNLLDNSLKYTDSGGELSVRLGVKGLRAVIEFADSAPGVAPDELERLFDRLYRVESSRNRALGGAGLGLAICRNIVAAHEGNITALRSPAGGVLIRVELPLAGSKS